MLYAFHVTLVSAGIVFAFGFALYQFLRLPGPVHVVLGVCFLAAGAWLALYLRRVLRYGLSARPPRPPRPPGS